MVWIMKRIGILVTGLAVGVVCVGGCGDKEEIIMEPQEQMESEVSPAENVSQESEVSPAENVSQESEVAPAENVSQESESPDLVPDIALEDVNPSSSFFGTKISPRHFLDQVSVWYFGHAT